MRKGLVLGLALSLVSTEALAQVEGSAAPATQPAPTTTETADTVGASTSLTLRAVLDSVETRFPLILAAAQDLATADAEQLTAEGAFDPQWRTRAGVAPLGYYRPLTLDTALTLPTQYWGAQFFAGYRLGQGLTYTGIPIYDGKYETNRYGELRAGVMLPLWRNRAIDRGRASLRRAELARSIAGLTLAQQRLEVTRTASLRYWDWVLAGQRLRVARALLAQATARDAGLGRRVDGGDLAAFERADNQRTILQRRGNVVSAERAVEQTALELGLFVRDNNGRARTPTLDELPPSPEAPSRLSETCVARSMTNAVTRRPEPQRYDLQRAREEIERDYHDNQRRPAIDVMTAVSQDIGPGSETRAPTVLEVGLTVEIPILNRAPTGRMQAAEAAMQRAGELARFARDRVRTDVQDALSAMRAAESRVAIARDERALADTLATQEQTRLTLGEGTILVLNLREQAAAEASLRVAEAQVDGQRAMVAWRYANGIVGDGDGCEP